jgi:hypothetical protein
MLSENEHDSPSGGDARLVGKLRSRRGAHVEHDNTLDIVLQEYGDQGHDSKPSLGDEWPSAVLLVVLYMIQGVPLGLSMGSM